MRIRQRVRNQALSDDARHQLCHNGRRMQEELAGQVNPTLELIRRRGQGYLGYLLWVFLILVFLWAANQLVTLVGRWMELLRNFRLTIGVPAPASGPDWWVLGGVGLLGGFALAIVMLAIYAYRAAWNRKLVVAWGSPAPRTHTRFSRLKGVADDLIVQRKSAYLCALLACPSWKRTELRPSSLDRDAYRAAAAAVLRDIEVDIAHRAVTVGLVIGLNRNPLIDSFTIIAAALELQLHVLTRLGKRPSLRSWIELVKRAGASVFLNTYVTREDAIYLNLAIRKAALGLEVASDTFQSTLADVDLDEVLGHTAIPGLSELAHVASLSMSVGASGLRQIGNFIEHTANDLLQGVMAAGILYYHGMALAAECLALDEEHRRDPEMSRTIAQAMTMACAPAGRLLRDQVRKMRQFLRERRRQIFTVAKENVGGAAGKLRDTVKDFTDRATGLFGKSR